MEPGFPESITWSKLLGGRQNSLVLGAFGAAPTFSSMDDRLLSLMSVRFAEPPVTLDTGQGLLGSTPIHVRVVLARHYRFRRCKVVDVWYECAARTHFAVVAACAAFNPGPVRMPGGA